MLFRSIVALLCCFTGLTSEASLKDETYRAAERPRMARRAAAVSRLARSSDSREPRLFGRSRSELSIPGEMAIEKTKFDYQSLLRPRFGLAFEWEPESSGLGL